MRYSDWVLHIFVEEIQCTSITNPIDAYACIFQYVMFLWWHFHASKKNLGALLSPSGIEDKYSWKREKFNELAHGQYASVGFRRCYPINVLKMFKAAKLVISKINQCDVILTTCSSILFHKKVFVTWPFCYPISASFKVMVTLLPILGITWLLGILVPVSDVFHYLFIIGTSMQVYYYFMIKMY